MESAKATPAPNTFSYSFTTFHYLGLAGLGKLGSKYSSHNPPSSTKQKSLLKYLD